MANYYLKADSENALWEALVAAGLAEKEYDEDDEANIRPEGAAENWEPTGSYGYIPLCKIDVIGTMYQPTGNQVEDQYGTLIEETAAVDGYHANLQAALNSSQKAALPILNKVPSTPYRKWAGV